MAESVKTYKCSCGKIVSKNDMNTSYKIKTEIVPKWDYDDLTPSRLVEWEEKRRFIYSYKCPACGKTLIEEKGSLF